MFPFRLFYHNRLLMGLTGLSEHRSLTWSASNTEKSFDSYYMTSLAKLMLLNKHIYRFIISNGLKKRLMVWTKNPHWIGKKKIPSIVKWHKCILDEVLLVREWMKLEMKSIFLWIERHFIFPDLMNIFVGFCFGLSVKIKYHVMNRTIR